MPLVEHTSRRIRPTQKPSPRQHLYGLREFVHFSHITIKNSIIPRSPNAPHHRMLNHPKSITSLFLHLHILLTLDMSNQTRMKEILPLHFWDSTRSKLYLTGDGTLRRHCISNDPAMQGLLFLGWTVCSELLMLQCRWANNHSSSFMHAVLHIWIASDCFLFQTQCFHYIPNTPYNHHHPSQWPQPHMSKYPTR